jgi:hypothetical protein
MSLTYDGAGHRFCNAHAALNTFLPSHFYPHNETIVP